MNDTRKNLPDGPLLSYYGDDFTGSTDVMEAFAASGIDTVLFLQLPRPSDLERFKNARCVGLAGISRGQTTEWMQKNLPTAFTSLASIGAPIVQYKVCSTFDSSATIGSIGQAIDIGMSVTQARWSPMVIGAPRLKRYQVFGHLFAHANGVIHRLDRHPTMSRHPVTPMNESDLAIHLAKQTKRRIALVNIADIATDQAQHKLDTAMGVDQPVVMIDVNDLATQIEAGRLIWENRGAKLFSASSSGLQYALTAYWRNQGLIPETQRLPRAQEVACIAAVSGSCSPVSGEQIKWAREHGFRVMRLNIGQALDQALCDTEISRLVDSAVAALAQNTSSIIFSAEGPDDPAVKNFDETVRMAKISRAQASQKIGEVLSEIMRRILDNSNVKRIAVAGGDSSGAVASHLEIRALTLEAGITPGVPLCRAWSDSPKRDGIEIALKGGQMGGASFYGELRTGNSAQ